jgi:hypothetical protein
VAGHLVLGVSRKQAFKKGGCHDPGRENLTWAAPEALKILISKWANLLQLFAFEKKRIRVKGTV